MVISSRLAAVAASIGAALVAVLVGCSTSGQPARSGTTTTAQSGTPSGQPATTSPTTSAPDHPGPNGTADGISITIAPQGGTTIKAGGPALRFSVALVN